MMGKFLSNLKSDEFWASLSGFILLALVIVALWAANFFAMPFLFPDTSGTTGNAGTAGDMFGGLTALFSGLAFAGLVTTLFMQRKELELQRKELSQTREVFSIQRFENTYFGMLRLFTDYVKDLTATKDRNSEPMYGKQVLRYYSNILPKPAKIKNTGTSYDPNFIDDGEYDHEELLLQYQKTYQDQMERDLGPYFRLIYNIIRLIENTNFDNDLENNEKIKLTYSKILRAYLSSSEVKIIMFNCASVYGAGLKSWVEKHSLLRHITRADYNEYHQIVKKYDKLAFRYDERNSAD